MDISDYLEVLSTEDRILHFKVKGFWTDEVVAQLGTQTLALLKEAVDSMGGKRFLALSDTTEFKPPSLEVKEIIKRIFHIYKL